MDEDTCDEYDAWDLSPLKLPQRSALYALHPVGLGTAQVESLTSYITRLAEAHHIFSGVLLHKMLAPLVSDDSPGQKHHGALRETGERSTLLNGSGLPARQVVHALKTLTFRTDLHCLTLLPLAAIFSARSRGSFRLVKAWCPVCYEEQRMKKQIVYDPLLWFFQDITVCLEHTCDLSVTCPYPDCAKRLPAVGWRTRPGYCSYCQRWLGRPPSSDGEPYHRENGQWRWQQWIVSALGEVLASLPTTSTVLERTRIHQIVVHAITQLSGGNIGGFARILGISRGTVDWWYQGLRVPECSKLLWFCYRIGLSLCQFLFDKVETLHFHFQEPLYFTPSTYKRSVIDAEQLYHKLEHILTSNEYPPPTLRKVTQQLGQRYDILSKIHSAACQGIVARRRAYVQQRKEDRVQQLQEEVKQVVLWLQTEGITPTQKRIAPYLSQPGILRNPQIRLFLHEILAR